MPVPRLRGGGIAFRHGVAGGLIIRLGEDETYSNGIKIVSDSNNSGVQVDRMVYSCKPSLLMYQDKKSIVVHESWRRTTGGDIVQQWAVFAILRLNEGDFVFKSYQITYEGDFLLTFVRTKGVKWPEPEVVFEEKLEIAHQAHKDRVAGLLKLRGYKSWSKVSAIEVRVVGGAKCPLFTLPELDKFMGIAGDGDDFRIPGKIQTANEVLSTRAKDERTVEEKDEEVEEERSNIGEAITTTTRPEAGVKAVTNRVDSIMSMKSWRK
jgi:hypothetical protein